MGYPLIKAGIVIGFVVTVTPFVTHSQTHRAEHTTTTKSVSKPTVGDVEPSVPYIFPQWDTTDTDSTAYRPTLNSPMADLPKNVQEVFACIRYAESRNHPTSVSYAGAGGLYQFMPNIWARYNGRVFAPRAELATPQQQDEIAKTVYQTNGGFYPEWQNACTPERK